MKYVKYIAACLQAAGLSMCMCTALQAANVIPRPLEMTEQAGVFTLSARTVVSSVDFPEEVQLLQQYLHTATGLSLRRDNTAKEQVLLLLLDTSLSANPEGYRLTADVHRVVITAATRQGFFYGLQTLQQLINPNGYTIHGIYIQDAPRFPWRGFMLDDARHMLGVAGVKHLLDEMALLKMNRLHWHLTDDQGWRIEIKKYPLLTSIGSRRSATQVENDDYSEKSTFRKEPYAGFYTQAQVRELVAYAADRHISIIPEIEMPGHATAAIASYTWLGAAHTPVTVSTTFGIHDEVLDISNPAVLDFMKDVLTELMPLFPSHVFHIGGDEVKFDQWVSSPAISSWMQSKGLNSGVDAQIWFANEIATFLQAHHCRLMAWNEVMGVKFDHEAPAQAPTQHADSNIIVQFWKGDLSRIPAALQAGHELVNSWHPFTYFPRSMEKIYSFDPRADIQPQQQAAIIGLECAVWTEAITSEKAFNALVYPRLAAYGEVGWTALANKQYTHFQAALPFFYRHWKTVGITH